MKKSHKIVGHIYPSFYNFPPHIRIDLHRLYGWGEKWLKANGLGQVLNSPAWMPVSQDTHPAIWAVALGQACAVKPNIGQPWVNK